MRTWDCDLLIVRKGAAIKKIVSFHLYVYVSAPSLAHSWDSNWRLTCTRTPEHPKHSRSPLFTWLCSCECSVHVLCSSWVWNPVYGKVRKSSWGHGRGKASSLQKCYLLMIVQDNYEVVAEADILAKWPLDKNIISAQQEQIWLYVLHYIFYVLISDSYPRVVPSPHYQDIFIKSASPSRSYCAQNLTIFASSKAQWFGVWSVLVSNSWEMLAASVI